MSESFQFDDLAGYAFDFAAAQLAAADDHLLALEHLLMNSRSRVAPFVLGRAAIEAAGRAYVLMDPKHSDRRRVEFVLAERIHELTSRKQLIQARAAESVSPKVVEDLFQVEYVIAALQTSAKQQGIKALKRPSFTSVLREVLGQGDEEDSLSMRATSLYSAIAHSVPEVLVGTVLDPKDPKWRPDRVGFFAPRDHIILDLITAVVIAHFHAVRLQIAAYQWPTRAWDSWGGQVRSILTSAIDADRSERKRSTEEATEEPLLEGDGTEEQVTEETLMRWMVEALEEAGVDPALIHATKKTGRIVAESTEHLLTEDELEEWRAAVREYREQEETN